MVVSLLLVLGAWLLWRIRTPELGRPDLLLAWALKVVAACIFLWVYSSYYGWGTLTADPAVFMRESRILANVATHSVPDYLRFLLGFENDELIVRYLSQTSHWSAGDLTLINDSRNVIRVNSLLWFISNGNTYVHLLVFSFLSLLGMRELYLAFYEQVRFSKRIFWFALVLLPSALFWTGSILKEPLMIVGLCLVLRAIFGKLSIGSATWRLVLGTLLMLAFKPYVLGCLLLALLFYFVARKLFRDRFLLAFFGCATLVSLLLLAFAKPRESIVHHLTRKQFDFINVGRGGLHAYADTCFFYFRPDQFGSLRFEGDSIVMLREAIRAKQVTLGKALPFRDVYLQPDGTRWVNYYQAPGCGSLIEVTPIDNSFAGLLRNIPQAFFNAGFRPLFGDPGGWLKYFAIAETLLLFAWLFWQLRNWRSLPKRTQAIVLSLLLFAVMLFVLIGWTTPVLGAIVRYRMPAYLALLLVSLLLYNQRKTKQHE